MFKDLLMWACTVFVILSLAIGVSILAYNMSGIDYQKRKVTVEKIEAMGYEVGKAGLDPNACPYTEEHHPIERGIWLKGWADGKMDKVQKPLPGH